MLLEQFTTHLIQHIHKIKNEEAMNIEDISRSLCNTIIGDGYIYWYGHKEMEGITSEVQFGSEPFPKSKVYDESKELSHLDRLIIATRFSNDEEVLPIVEKGKKDGAEVIVLTTVLDEGDPLIEKADFYIDLKLAESLLPYDGGKIGYPAVLLLFYIYYALYITVKEIIDDFESPLPTFE